MIGLPTLERTSTYNINQLTQLVPSLNYTSPNPRNTALTIRGLGSSVVAIAQANDGLEPGVGYYVDQVYHGRPATAAFDFVDIERVEVLRGPQGTVFGKNTTAGLINITTRAPTFDREIIGEVTGGNLGFFQAKAALSGAIVDNTLAARASIAFTKRNGVIENVTTGADNNTVNNVVPAASSFIGRTKISAFCSPRTTAPSFQVLHAGVRARGTHAEARFAALSSARRRQEYAPPSMNPYDRKTDIDANLAVDTSEGGASGIADWNFGPVTLTSVSAWRWWNWDAANDRDYTSLIIQTCINPFAPDPVQPGIPHHLERRQQARLCRGPLLVSADGQGPSDHRIRSRRRHWLLGPPPGMPGNLLDGYVTEGHTTFKSDSYAAFGELVWHVTDRLSVSPGLRYTYEEKDGTFESQVVRRSRDNRSGTHRAQALDPSATIL